MGVQGVVGWLIGVGSVAIGVSVFLMCVHAQTARRLTGAQPWVCPLTPHSNFVAMKMLLLLFQWSTGLT